MSLLRIPEWRYFTMILSGIALTFIGGLLFSGTHAEIYIGGVLELLAIVMLGIGAVKLDQTQ